MNQTQPPRPKIAALLFAATALLTLVTVGRISGHGLWVTEVLDAAHGPVFAALALIAMAVLRQRGRPRVSVVWEYAASLAAALLLGGLVELVQFSIGRDASIGDLGRDALGAVAALGVFSLRDPRLHSLGVRLPIRIVGALLALWEPYPDWRGYERLALDVGNPTEAPLLLQVHVRDQSQSRDRQSGYVGRIEVPPTLAASASDRAAAPDRWRRPRTRQHRQRRFHRAAPGR